MKKRTFDVSFKMEVLEFCERNVCSPYKAVKHFRERDNYPYSQSMFYQWVANGDKIRETATTKKRATGGGILIY